MSLKSDPIKTVLTITVSFIVVYAITKWQWAFNLSIIVGVTGLLSNYIAKGISFIWLKASWILGMIVPNILLALVYILLLIPLAYLSRIFGASNQITLKNTEQSLFKVTNKDFEKNSFEKMW